MDIQTLNSLKHFDTIQDYLLAAIRTLNHRRLDQRETLLGPWHANLCIFALHYCTLCRGMVVLDRYKYKGTISIV